MQLKTRPPCSTVGQTQSTCRSVQYNVWFQPNRTRPADRLPVCHVTNTGEEVWKNIGRDPLDDEVGEYVEVTQIPNPELGPLEGRVKRTWLEGLTNNEIDHKETEYWFSTPPEGWLRERFFREYSPEAPVEFADARHFGEGRTSIDDLNEGMVLEGEVTDQWLYHGAEIDIGAQFDGLLPIMEHEWKAVREVLTPGTKIKIKIHKIRSPTTMWRWPIQLTIEEPAGIQQLLCDPDEWTCSVDTRGWEPDAIAAVTGRRHEVISYFAQPDETEMAERMQQDYGYDDEDMQAGLDDQSREERSYWFNEEAQAEVESALFEM